MQRYAELEAAGVFVTAVFHSPVASLRNHVKVKEDIPFPLLADPEKQIFAQYGVESSAKAMLAPAVMGKAMRAMAKGYVPNLLRNEGGQNGLPADFIIYNGVIQYAHYGKHAGDTIAVDEVLQLVQQNGLVMQQ